MTTSHDFWYVLHREDSSESWCVTHGGLSRADALRYEMQFKAEGQQTVVGFGTLF